MKATTWVSPNRRGLPWEENGLGRVFRFSAVKEVDSADLDPVETRGVLRGLTALPAVLEAVVVFFFLVFGFAVVFLAPGFGVFLDVSSFFFRGMRVLPVGLLNSGLWSNFRG